MAGWRIAAAAALLLLQATQAGAQTGARPDPRAQQQAETGAVLARFTSPRLTRFADDAELLAYLDAATDAARARRLWWARRPVMYASIQSQVPPPACPEDEPDCLQSPAEDPALRQDTVVVTGTIFRSPTNPSITNNQMAGVDEGDIVKQIGQFLVVLQDGRLFVIDTRGGGGGDLVLTDRKNVYRTQNGVDWYDEMLVRGDRIIVTAYSYQQRATEISVLTLGADGRLRPEGVFYMSSNDYYSTSNYATRLVGDNLVVYTPIALRELSSERRFKWPVVRRWVEGETRDEAEERGRPLFDAHGIYRPVRTTFEPVIHTVSICPLDSARSPAGLDCRSTAFVGPEGAQFYVTDEDAYLWTVPGPWERGQWTDGDEATPLCSTLRGAPAMPASLFRVPISGREPMVLGTAGIPIDQFSLEASRGQFRALTVQQPLGCRTEWSGGNPSQLAYMSVPLTSFSPVLGEVGRRAYTNVPSVGTTAIANRFSERYLVYGALRQRVSGQPRPAYAIPLDRPRSPVTLDLPHNVIRAEQAGPNIVLTGYESRVGLNISLIDLRGRPEVASTLLLPGRSEGEGRSHAFNSRIDEDGSGLMGLPTVRTGRGDERWPWRSEASDVSFVRVDSAGGLADIGRLTSRVPDGEGDEVGDPSYLCEVSCIDWYGNSRPIFTDGRIFALTGNELIEGRVGGGHIREMHRLDLTRPIGTRSGPQRRSR